MQLTLRKQASQGTVGLDIDGSFLAMAEVSKGVVSRVANRDLPSGIAPDGEVRDADALASEIKQLFGRGPVTKDVRLGVANQQIVVRQLELPHIEDAKERDAAVRFQAAEAVPMPLEDAILDHQIVEQVMVDGVFKDRVVVVAARRSMIERLLEAARKAGLKPQGIDLNAFALVRTLAPSDGHDMETSASSRGRCVRRGSKATATRRRSRPRWPRRSGSRSTSA